eukprot:scaffold7349_cov173-Amphora_coffeaeformis.AAC.23
MKGFVQCALVAMTALSLGCEGAVVRGLQSNETETSSPTMPPVTAMAMTPVATKGKGKGSSMPSDMTMAPIEAKGKMISNSYKESKSKKTGYTGKSAKGTSSMMGSKKTSMKSTSAPSGMSKKGKGKSGKSAKGSGKSAMKMRMMGKGKGKGIGTNDQPTPAPQPTLPPIGPGETRAPTPPPTDPLPFPELEVTFTLFYTIEQFRLPLPSEFATVADITEEHVTPFFESGFDNDELVTYSSSSTTLLNTGFNFGEPVSISYTSKLVFTQDSFVPRESEVEALVTAAFSGNNLNRYLGQLTSLPQSNIFRTTSQVSFQAGTGAETRTVESSSGFSNILIGAGAGAGMAALAIAGLVLSGRRREKEQVRQKTLGADGHMTVGDTTFDSRSINERAEDSHALEEVNLD